MTPDFITGQIVRYYYDRTYDRPANDCVMMVTIIDIEYRLKVKGYLVLSLSGAPFWAPAEKLEAFK